MEEIMIIKIFCWVLIIGSFCFVYGYIFKRLTKGVVYRESLIGIGPAFLGMILGGLVSGIIYKLFLWIGLF